MKYKQISWVDLWSTLKIIHQINENITKFERIKQAYSILELKYEDGNLLDISIIAYYSILKECNNYSGLAADYICVALYFYLINHPDVIII